MVKYADRVPDHPISNPSVRIVPVWRANGRPDNIVRHRQLGIIDASSAPVMLVLAPAGFGKSTLLQQWADAYGRPVAWLTVTHRLHDLRRFASQLAGALRDGDLDATSLEQVTASPEAVDVEMVLDGLLADISSSQGSVAIILDDVHLVTNEETSDFIAELVEELPENVRLIIGSREPPALPIARLRVRGSLDVLNAEDLRFTDAEAIAFLSNRLEFAVSERVVRNLVRFMEGWAAGLEMAVLAIDRQAPDDFDAILERFGGNDQLLREYLLDEVLERQRPRVKSFLLQTSICERFNRELCEAITGMPECADLLDEVERGGLFVTATDPSREWYRYHQLFRDFLRERLSREMGDDAVAELHRHAASWLASKGSVEEAISHAVSALDLPLFKNLIQPEIVRLFESDRYTDIINWFAEFPADLVDGDPLLNFYLAYSLARLGRSEEALARGEMAERLWHSAGETEGLIAVTLARGAVARYRAEADELFRQARRGIQLTAEAFGVDAEDPGSPEKVYRFRVPGLTKSSNATCFLQLGVAHRLQGESMQAESVLKELHAETVKLGHAIIAQEAMVDLGIVWYHQGRTFPAYDAWNAVLTDSNAATLTGRRQALIYAADLHRERSELAEAEALLTEAQTLTRRTRTMTLLPELCITWANFEWARCNAEQAFKRIVEAISSAQALKSDRLRRQAEAIRARFWLRQGDVDLARTWAWESGLVPDAEPEYSRFDEQLTFARVLIASEKPREAVTLLRRMLTQATADGRHGDALKVRIVLALAYQDLFELDRAIATIEPALELAHHAGYVRSFLDEGTPMIRLLRVAMRREVTTMPVVELLRMAGEEVTISRVTHSDLVEAISGREVEVLTLIALGLSNKEIAEELFISVSTVKRHITNAYGKLGVSGRTEAVERARSLSIL